MGLAETLKAVSHPIRREILNLLKTGPKSAGELSGQFSETGATISHHLSILKKAGLIVEEKQKNFIYYHLDASIFEEILVWIEELGGKKHDDITK